MKPSTNIKSPGFWRLGEPFVWLTGAAMALVLILAGGMLVVVAGNGLGVFWPARLEQFEMKDKTVLLGAVTQRSAVRNGVAHSRLQVKVGNRDLSGADFRWIDADAVARTSAPPDALLVERREFGDFHGFLVRSATAGGVDGLRADWLRVRAEFAGVAELGKAVSKINDRMEGIRRDLLRLRYRNAPESGSAIRGCLARQAELKVEFDRLVAGPTRSREGLRRHTATFRDAAGREKEIPLTDIVRFCQPNILGVGGKAGWYLEKVWELFFAEPREANTEGGLFPAIMGTVMMVFLMSLFSFPLGVVTAVYLREYARDGWLVRVVRIAVNNLAGIPSIVYGIFGLGFFIYGVGSGLDRLFFPERLPTPTFGTGGILWASLTLALLTVPVVIVATEEALGAIPAGVRHASLALGATKLQTLLRVLLPMASPGIMTGFILAMARAAGEVAPLMITGVVKLAPAMPLDGNFPFFHVDRKFMHLGFHIYDIGFQSPNVEAAKPMVYVTTLLLLFIVLLMSSSAILLRNRMKKRYTLGSF